MLNKNLKIKYMSISNSFFIGIQLFYNTALVLLYGEVNQLLYMYGGAGGSVTQSCPTLHGLSPPGSSVHGVLQARVLEWVAISFSRGSSPPRNWTWDSCTAGSFFTDWATREAHIHVSNSLLITYIHTTWRSKWRLTPIVLLGQLHG